MIRYKKSLFHGGLKLSFASSSSFSTLSSSSSIIQKSLGNILISTPPSSTPPSVVLTNNYILEKFYYNYLAEAKKFKIKEARPTVSSSKKKRFRASEVFDRGFKNSLKYFTQCNNPVLISHIFNDIYYPNLSLIKPNNLIVIMETLSHHSLVPELEKIFTAFSFKDDSLSRPPLTPLAHHATPLSSTQALDNTLLQFNAYEYEKLYRLTSKETSLLNYLSNYLALHYNHSVAKYHMTLKGEQVQDPSKSPASEAQLQGQGLNLLRYRLPEEDLQRSFLISIQKGIFSDLYSLLTQKKALLELFSNFFNIIHNFILSKSSERTSDSSSKYPTGEVEVYLQHYFSLLQELKRINVQTTTLENLKETLDKVLHYHLKATGSDTDAGGVNSGIKSASKGKANLKALLYENHLSTYRSKFNELLAPENLHFHFSTKSNRQLNGESAFFQKRLLLSLLGLSSAYPEGLRESLYFYEHLEGLEKSREGHQYISVEDFTSSFASPSKAAKSGGFTLESYQTHRKNDSGSKATQTEFLKAIHLLSPAGEGESPSSPSSSVTVKEQDLLLSKALFLSRGSVKLSTIVESICSLTLSSVFSNKFNLFDILEKREAKSEGREDRAGDRGQVRSKGSRDDSSSLFSASHLQFYQRLNAFNIEENLLSSLTQNPLHMPCLFSNLSLSDSTAQYTAPSLNLFQFLSDIDRHDLLLALITTGLKIYKLSQNPSFYAHAFLSLNLLEACLLRGLKAREISSSQHADALERVKITRNSLFLGLSKSKTSEYDPFFSSLSLLPSQNFLSASHFLNSSQVFSFLSFPQVLSLITPSLLSSPKSLASFISFSGQSGKIQYHSLMHFLHSLAFPPQGGPPSPEAKIFLNYVQTLTNSTPSPSFTSTADVDSYTIQPDKVSDSLLPMGYRLFLTSQRLTEGTEADRDKNLVKSLIFYTYSNAHNRNFLSPFKLLELFSPTILAFAHASHSESDLRKSLSQIHSLLLESIDEILQKRETYSSIYSRKPPRLSPDLVKDDDFLAALLQNRLATRNTSASDQEDDLVAYFEALRTLLASPEFLQLLDSSLILFQRGFTSPPTDEN